MRYGELVRKLRRLGLEYERASRGSHEIWIWPEREIAVIIPHHASREIPTGTLRAILRKLELTESELNRL